MMKKVNEDRLIETFLELLPINGPSFKEKPVADYLKRWCGKLGLEIEEDDAARTIGGSCGNLLIRMAGESSSSPGIIFGVHLDTIQPTGDLKVVEKGGIFFSSGSTILGADDRAGIAVLLELAQGLIENGGSPVPLEFLFTVAEETGLLGAKAIKAGWLRAKMAFILDGGGEVGRVTNRAPYGRKLRATVTGRAAHAGVEPEAGISAIMIASRAISRMKLGRIDENTTANIGKIEGGEAQNIIPERAEVSGEARSLNENSLKLQVEHMGKAFRAAAEELGGEVEFVSERDYPGYSIPRRSPAVELVEKAAAALGIKFELEASCGASDANFINGLGIAALNLSVGYKKPHTREENISRQDLINTVRLARGIVRLAGKM